MTKGLVAAAVAFVVAFGAERMIAGMAADVARYDRLRKMSDEPPLFKELLSFVGAAIGKNGPGGFIADVSSDLVRYAKIKSM
jgi:hypothetical protein